MFIEPPSYTKSISPIGATCSFNNMPLLTELGRVPLCLVYKRGAPTALGAPDINAKGGGLRWDSAKVFWKVF